MDEMNIDITDLVRDYLIRYTKWLEENHPVLPFRPLTEVELADAFLEEVL